MKIRVVVKEPFQDYKVELVDPSEFRKIVGGLIQFVPVTERIEVVVNEEGKLNGLPANLRWEDDILFGTVIFTKFDPIAGETDHLTKRQANQLIEEFLKARFIPVTEEENEEIEPDDYMKIEFYSF